MILLFMSEKIKLSSKLCRKNLLKEEFAMPNYVSDLKNTVRHTKNLACIGSSLCKKGCWMEAQAAFLPF